MQRTQPLKAHLVRSKLPDLDEVGRSKPCGGYHLCRVSQMESTGGGGQFGQNGQKLHEIDKTSIFGSNQWVGEGHGGGQAIFSGSVGDPPSVPPPTMGNPVYVKI